MNDHGVMNHLNLAAEAIAMARRTLSAVKPPSAAKCKSCGEVLPMKRADRCRCGVSATVESDGKYYYVGNFADAPVRPV